jgi:hypothetical protein
METITIRFGILSLVVMVAGSVSNAQEREASFADATAVLIRTACDANSPSELREFKKRQILRRQTYVENAIEAMKADASSNALIYSAEDQRDFKETLNRMQVEHTQLQEFAVDGCSEKSLRQFSSPEPGGPSIAAVIVTALKTQALSKEQQAGQPQPQSPASQGAPGNSSPTPKKTDSASKSPDSNATPKKTATDSQDDNANKPAGDDVTKLKTQVKSIEEALSGQNQDFALVLGVGSMVINPHVSDYKNDSNVLHTTNQGSSTPQLLAGVSFRSHVPSLTRHYRGLDLSCTDPTKKCGEAWQVHPWSGFVSLKFAPGASQLLNGYVIGGTYSITKYLDVLVGFSMTPANEASPGFRTTAAQFVTNQQKLGLDLNFNPTAMLLNRRNAFDGFPVTDASGKLLYAGDPLTVHYRAGAVFGVSFPIYFRSYLKPSTTGSN